MHLGPGPAVDDIHARSLRAALLTGETLEITDPGESEDIGVDWADPRALTVLRRPRADRAVELVRARPVGHRPHLGRLPRGHRVDPDRGTVPVRRRRSCDGGVLLIETSEELLPARNVGWIVRALGERGILSAVDAVLVARPPVSDFTRRPPPQERARLRAEQRDAIVEVMSRYNPEAVVCVGIPFGHTRPQWILPHGGTITVDGAARRIFADYR